MILKAFSEYLKQDNNGEKPFIALEDWLNSILSKKAENNIERIIHAEIEIKKDKYGKSFFKGKDKNGDELLENLYYFAQSFEQQNFNRWLHFLKASDFYLKG